MPLSAEEVKHLAALARLEITDEEARRYEGELTTILGYVVKLQELSVPTGADERPAVSLRADEVQPWPEPENLVSQAPQNSHNLIEVPAVFEDR